VGPIWLMATMPYVSVDAAAKSRDVTRGGRAQALVATGWFALTVALLVRFGQLPEPRLVVITIALGAVTALSGWYYWARARGVTGDFLGATEQLGELAALAVLAWRT